MFGSVFVPSHKRRMGEITSPASMTSPIGMRLSMPSMVSPSGAHLTMRRTMSGSPRSPVVRHLTTRRLIRITNIQPLGSDVVQETKSVWGREKSVAIGGSVRRQGSVLEALPLGLEPPDDEKVRKEMHYATDLRCAGIRHCLAGILLGMPPRSAPRRAPEDNGAAGILVHGCHLLADGWENLVWGSPPDALGRLPHAVLLAWEESAGVVVFGTGASEMDGKKESEVTLQYLWDHFAELSQFDALKNVPLAEAEKMMRRIAVLDKETQNTDQEVRNGLKVMAEHRCSHAILVSSPTHLPRCLACACKVVGAEPELFTRPVYASPSDTCYEGASASDVVIVEPPHRGDRDRNLDGYEFHELVKRMFRVGPAKKAEFFGRVISLLQEYGV